jgi:hypothetical protein
MAREIARASLLRGGRKTSRSVTMRVSSGAELISRDPGEESDRQGVRFRGFQKLLRGGRDKPESQSDTLSH